MNRKIGAITIGQSPRNDLIPEIEEYFMGAEVLQAGALDGLSKEEIQALLPEEGDTVLVSRLRDKSWAVMGERKIVPLLQKCVDALTVQNVSFIILLCTGKFAEALHSPVPVIYPQKLIYGIVPALADGKRIGIVNPEATQIGQCIKNWGAVSDNITVTSLNPYDANSAVESAAAEMVRKQADIIILDCMGYTRKMKSRMEELTGKPVILPRTLVARIVGELLE
ncbi:MAG: AroM family protein [Coprococcus sp.]|nr:AroM family protein [Coprococcus sp.]